MYQKLIYVNMQKKISVSKNYIKKHDVITGLEFHTLKLKLVLTDF